MAFDQVGFQRSGDQPIELIVTAFAESLDLGVNAVSWVLSGCVVGTGDGVFVDARLASSRWASTGDVVAYAPRRLAGRPAITGVASPNGRWLLRSGEDDSVTVVLPCAFLPCLAAFYGWLLDGRRLACWPFQAMTRLSGQVPLGGSA